MSRRLEAGRDLSLRGWPGPRLTLLLPSFSGATEDYPELLQYTCCLRANVRLTSTASLEVGEEADSPEALVPILGGRPLIALNFHDMEMSVREPTVLKASERRVSKQGQLQRA